MTFIKMLLLLFQSFSFNVLQTGLKVQNQRTFPSILVDNFPFEEERLDISIY